MKSRDKALLRSYRKELGIQDDVPQSYIDMLISQIKEASVLTEREVGTVILVYTDEDYLHRSLAEKEIVSALKENHVKVVTLLVKANTPVRKYSPWPFPSVPKPDYWDETILVERKI